MAEPDTTASSMTEEPQVLPSPFSLAQSQNPVPKPARAGPESGASAPVVPGQSPLHKQGPHAILTPCMVPPGCASCPQIAF